MNQSTMKHTSNLCFAAAMVWAVSVSVSEAQYSKEYNPWPVVGADTMSMPFLGGINDLPAGKHGYFTVELEQGDYAFIAEMPDPQAAGFVLPFSVKAGPQGL